MTRTIPFDVRNCWTGDVRFMAQIKCAGDAPIAVKRGLAARWAIEHGAYLSDAYLSGADLSDAYLSGACLSGADLSGADLSDAYLSDADLSDAYLSGADLSDAYLSGADLSDAYLSGADLSDADLSDADLSGANLNGTIGNMREVKSAQFDRWPITWTQPRDGEPILQIGCQKHPLSKWEGFSLRKIQAMDKDYATAWWSQYRDVVLALVNASPAVPFEVKS